MLSTFSRGWGGLLAFPPLIVTCLVFQVGLSQGFARRGDGPVTGAVLVAVAAGLWFLGRRINRGARSWQDAPHSFCMVPAEWFGLALGAAGAFLGIGTLFAPA